MIDDAQARALIERALAPGEQIVWSQAAPWGATLTSNAMIVVVTLAFTAAWFFFRASILEALRTGEWWRRAGIGLFLAMLAVMNVVALAQASSSFSTAYAVTDRRVLVVQQGPWRIDSTYDADSGATGVEVHGDRIDILRDGRRHGFWRPMFGVRDTARVAALVRACVFAAPDSPPDAE